MSKALAVISLSLTTILIAALVIADEPDPQHVFEERYAVMKSAMAKRDGDAIASLFTSDFVSTDVSGQTVTASQMIDEVKALPVDPLKVSKTTVHSVKIKDDLAIVDQSYDMKTRKTGIDGSIQNVELKTTSKDTWIKKDGIWLCKNTTTNQVDYYVNGQPLIHKTRQE